MPVIYHFLLGVAIVMLTGCSTYGVIDNSPKNNVDNTGYSWHTWAKTDHNDDLSIIVSFSGGGTRAAALSYGVLKGLRDTYIPVNGKSVRMLDEIDYISSVSGGSFTSAYYGLYGDGIFESFEEAFLLRDVEQYLFWGLANPIEWFRKGGRTEMAIRHYNDNIFHGATFADMNPENGPLIIINASGLSNGVRFSFLQEYFNIFCSDMSDFPVAKAVAASSAVPIVFLPVVLEKYSECDTTEPEWLAVAKKKAENDVLLNETVSGIESLRKKGERRYLHLIDGGITDNLGLLAMLDIIALTGGSQQTLRKLNKKPPKHLIVISVNSSTEPQPDMDLSNKEPSIGETIDSMSNIQLHRYNTTTLELMKKSLKKWADEASTPEHTIKPYFIRIGLKGIQEKKMQTIFNKIPTSFALSKETVDQLVKGGHNLLLKDPEFQRLILDLKGTINDKGLSK